MRIVSFSVPSGPSFGLVVAGGIVDLRRRLPAGVCDIHVLLDRGELPLLKAHAGAEADYALEDVRFLPALPSPRKMIGIGLNYAAHAGEAGAAPPKFPRVFSRWIDSLVGHDEPLIKPEASDQFDFEGELAVVIGKSGHRIPASEAMDYVVGYTCFNDGSIRDWQEHTTTAGKNFVSSGSLGPFLVTTDESFDPAAMTIVSRVNGIEMQRASTGEMIYDIPRLIEYCSQIAPLSPGDVIGTGTPAGTAMHRKPPAWLKAHDVVEISISGLGTLRNTVIDASSLE